MSEPTFPRPFTVQRDEDISGISGEGVVAEGAQFSDGWVVTHWLDKPPMNEPKTDVWHNKGARPFERVHGHGGATRILWADEVNALRRQFLADVVEAYDVPAGMAGPEAERGVLRRRVERAIQATQDGHAAPVEVGDERIVDAVMPIVGQVLEQRDQALGANGRAYGLARSWERAHGSAMFLVRAAAAELRDALDDSGAAPGEVVHSGVNGQASGLSGVDYVAAAECSAQHHLFPGDHRECIRAAQHRGDHIDERGFHWSATVAVYPVAMQQAIAADLRVENRALRDKVVDLEHAREELRAERQRICLTVQDARGRARTPGARDVLRALVPVPFPDLPAEQLPPDQSPAVAVEVRDPCPYCEDCRLIPRTLMAVHIREHHPDVTIAGHENGTAMATEATRAAIGPEPDDWVTEECPHCEEPLSRNRLDEHVATAHADLPQCTATLTTEHTDGTITCVFRAGHRDGEYGSHHASAHGEMSRTVWADWARGATPHREQDTTAATEATLAAGESESSQRTRGQRLLDAPLRQRIEEAISEAWKTGLAHSNAKRVRKEIADAVMAVVDPALAAAAAYCDLPHEMED